MLRRRIGIGLCVAIVSAGVGASLAGYKLAKSIENVSISLQLERDVEQNTRQIERGLRESIIPISALAVFLGSQTSITDAQFQAAAAEAAKLGIPAGRLVYAPVVTEEERDAFEKAAQEAGLINYHITEMMPDGRFVTAKRRSHYVPVRLERVERGYPGNLGFDIRSDPVRRQALDVARDSGMPVAIQPTLRQRVLLATPTEVIYWPVYAGDASAESVDVRRAHLKGYVSIILGVSDLLTYATRDGLSGLDRVLFVVRGIDDDGIDHAVATYVNGSVLPSGNNLASTSDSQFVVFRREFTLLRQHWTLEHEFSTAAVSPLYASTPTFTLLGGLVLTGGLGLLLFDYIRRTEIDRSRQRLLAALTRQQEQSNLALQDMNKKLEVRERTAAQLARGRTRFLAVAAHELRQPLHASTLLTTALLRRVNDAESREIVGSLQELTLSMHGMFTNLLDLSRLDGETLVVQIQPVALDALFVKIIGDLAREAAGKGVSLRKAGTFPTIDTDPLLLETIGRNLIGNAVKFTDRGNVLVSARLRGASLKIEIWDTGPGIPPEQLERIFDEFERLRPTSNKPGIGLGLSIVRQLSRAIGADVTVCSKPGKGSRFTVRLSIS